VIEDEPGIGRVVSRALSSARFQIDGVADGRSGLEWARSGHHELVLLDRVRSGLDGVGSAGLTVKVARRTPPGISYADGQGHGRVDRAPGHHHADREVARS
jgi:DNA-binding response OmpR family regulator